MAENRTFTLWVAFLSGLSGAIIAAAVTYWGAVQKSKDEALLQSTLANAKEEYLNQIKDSISQIAKAEANAENAVINTQKIVAELSSTEQLANSILKKLTDAQKISESDSIQLNDESLKIVSSNVSKSIIENQIPSGAVIPFNSDSCPEKWEEYKLAYGRFVRGIDKTGRLDPDGIRLAGDVQSHTFLNHSHSISGAKTAAHQPQVGSPHGYHPGALGNTINKTSDLTGDNVGKETRPVNVALLYCVKK